MGVDWSGMMRVFVKGTRKQLTKKIMHDLAEKVFNVRSREEYVKIHTDFCEWGKRNIDQAERKRRNGEVIVQKARASYGQIAKTLDVTLKVAIYYCHLPDCETSRRICHWLNAAVDTAMMDKLQEAFDAAPPLPTSIKEVDGTAYDQIQNLVRESIKREHNNAITPPQWEDIHWVEANE